MSITDKIRYILGKNRAPVKVEKLSELDDRFSERKESELGQ